MINLYEHAALGSSSEPVAYMISYNLSQEFMFVGGSQQPYIHHYHKHGGCSLMFDGIPYNYGSLIKGGNVDTILVGILLIKQLEMILT